MAVCGSLPGGIGMNQELWEKVVKKHGHECAGVAIGFRVGQEAMRIFDEEEQVICVTSLTNCVVDGVAQVLGLSVKDGTMRMDPRVEGLIFYALNDEEGWQFQLKKLEIAEEADPVLMILASNRDKLFDIVPCDVPVGMV